MSSAAASNASTSTGGATRPTRELRKSRTSSKSPSPRVRSFAPVAGSAHLGVCVLLAEKKKGAAAAAAESAAGAGAGAGAGAAAAGGVGPDPFMGLQKVAQMVEGAKPATGAAASSDSAPATAAAAAGAGATGAAGAARTSDAKQPAADAKGDGKDDAKADGSAGADGGFVFRSPLPDTRRASDNAHLCVQRTARRCGSSTAARG